MTTDAKPPERVARRRRCWLAPDSAATALQLLRDHELECCPDTDDAPTYRPEHVLAFHLAGSRDRDDQADIVRVACPEPLCQLVHEYRFTERGEPAGEPGGFDTWTDVEVDGVGHP